MLHHVPFDKLGRFQLDWLDSHFHFFFSGVPAPMGQAFGPLRVWNDDLIKAGSGFDMHGHRDMEIITYIRRGAISHRDNLGNSGKTDAGDVQVMSAGTGIMHAEFNQEPIDNELFQIWVEPNRRGLAPRWETASFPKADRAGKLVPLASGEASVSGALTIHQNATLYGANLPAGSKLIHVLKPGRRAYLVPASGSVTVNGAKIGTREGLAIVEEPKIEIATSEPSEILLFDLP
jgi:hypothetical protein